MGLKSTVRGLLKGMNERRRQFRCKSGFVDGVWRMLIFCVYLTRSGVQKVPARRWCATLFSSCRQPCQLDVQSPCPDRPIWPTSATPTVVPLPAFFGPRTVSANKTRRPFYSTVKTQTNRDRSNNNAENGRIFLPLALPNFNFNYTVTDDDGGMECEVKKNG